MREQERSWGGKPVGMCNVGEGELDIGTESGVCYCPVSSHSIRR